MFSTRTKSFKQKCFKQEQKVLNKNKKFLTRTKVLNKKKMFSTRTKSF